MFERILVGVDSEGLARQAAARALDLARTFDAKLHAVHAVHVPSPTWIELKKSVRDAFLAQTFPIARQRVLASLEEVEGHERLEDDLRLVDATPAQAILTELEAWRADLLVLGRHAKHGLFDFGSTARAVLSHCSVPLWVQSTPVAPVRSVLAAVDLSDHSKKALGLADALAVALGAQLHVMSCWVPPAFAYGDEHGPILGPTYVVDADAEANEAEFGKWIDEVEWRGERPATIFRRGEPVASVSREADEHDLVVLGTHGRSGLSRFFLGSVAYGVLKRTPGPVLVVPDAERTWGLSTSGA